MSKTCGATCPQHAGLNGSKCAVVGSDGAGLFGAEKDRFERALGPSPTLAEHRRSGRGHLCLAGGVPHGWQGPGAPERKPAKSADAPAEAFISR